MTVKRVCKNYDVDGTEIYQPVYYYLCEMCKTEICESDYHYTGNGNRLCNECAFKNYLTTDEYYLNGVGLCSGIFKASIHPENGEIVVTYKKSKFPWERTLKQHRHSAEYVAWRTSVFSRDDHTCQQCNLRGGKLNAHHIKSFNDYPELRYNIDNGITYCLECHKELHRKKVA